MDYGYKITTHGRALMAMCMDQELPLKLTRAAVGSGRVDETVNLADVHDLLRYVTDAAIGERRHEEDRLYLTIQYDNSAHPEVEAFQLNELIVYAQHPKTGEETDLLYATLGDYGQPVPQYTPSMSASVCSYPLVLVLSDEVTVHITASPGLVSYDELAAALSGLGTRRLDLMLPIEGWTDDGAGKYPYRLDIPVDGATAQMIPTLTVLEAGEEAAIACGLCPRAQTLDGALRVFAATAPTAPIPASLTLQGDASGLILGGGSGGNNYVLPVATEHTLGGVKVGKGVSVAADGTITVDNSAALKDAVASDESIGALLDEIFDENDIERGNPVE